MQVRRAALAAWLLLGAGIPDLAVDPMTLDDAFDRGAPYLLAYLRRGLVAWVARKCQ
jgi:hypothetical protein